MGYARRRPRFVCGFAGAVVAGDVCGARAALALRARQLFSEGVALLLFLSPREARGAEKLAQRCRIGAG